MTKEQLIDTLGKYVYPVIKFDSPQDKLDYADSIFALCGRTDGLKFVECVKHVMSGWKQSGKPKAGHFRDAYQYLAKENGWYVEERKACLFCGGFGFVRLRVTRTQDDGKIHEALENCSKCRTKWTRKEDLVVIETPEESYYVKTARGMTPNGAAFVLDQIESGKFKPPADVTDALVAVLLERSAGATKTESPYKAVLDAVAPEVNDVKFE